MGHSELDTTAGRGLQHSVDHGPSTELAPRYRSMVIISINRPLPEDLTEKWLLSVLPEAPAAQIRDAVMVLATDPGARLMRIVKNEAIVGEYLEMHTAAIG